MSYVHFLPAQVGRGAGAFLILVPPSHINNQRLEAEDLPAGSSCLCCRTQSQRGLTDVGRAQTHDPRGQASATIPRTSSCERGTHEPEARTNSLAVVNELSAVKVKDNHDLISVPDMMLNMVWRAPLLWKVPQAFGGKDYYIVYRPEPARGIGLN